MSNLHETLKKIVHEEFNYIIKNFNTKFVAWERFYKFDVLYRYMYYTNMELKHVISNKIIINEESNINHPPLTEEDSKFLIDYAFEFIKTKNIQPKTLDDYLPAISKIFEDNGIDFKNLSKEEQLNLLKEEDINPVNDIFNKLNLTHIQFKYLYQTGSVLIKD